MKIRHEREVRMVCGLVRVARQTVAHAGGEGVDREELERFAGAQEMRVKEIDAARMPGNRFQLCTDGEADPDGDGVLLLLNREQPRSVKHWLIAQHANMRARWRVDPMQPRQASRCVAVTLADAAAAFLMLVDPSAPECSDAGWAGRWVREVLAMNPGWGATHGALALDIAREAAYQLAHFDGVFARARTRRDDRRHGRALHLYRWLARRGVALCLYGSSASARIGEAKELRVMGRFEEAQDALFSAIRLADLAGDSDTKAMAYLELFALAHLDGNYASAERWAEYAHDSYSPGHADLVPLAANVALMWARRGDAARALPVFEALLPRFATTGERLFAHANIARCAGMLRMGNRFDAAAARVWALADQVETAQYRADALVALACGAVALDRRELAESALEDATWRAEEAGDVDTLRRIARVRQAGAELPATRSDAVERLSRKLVVSLRAA